MLKATIAAVALAIVPGPAGVQDSKSKNPPEGAPWTQDFFGAREAALASGKPIFLYSTKTY